MSGPSDKAVEAALAACPVSARHHGAIALDAAHDPALGLERSVCLRDAEREIVAKVVEGEYPVAYETIRADVIRDVVAAVRERVPIGYSRDSVVEFIEREFAPVAAARSFGVEVVTDDTGQFAGNAVRFRTPSEAEAYGAALALRWTLVREWRVSESDRPANYEWVAGHLKTLDDDPPLPRRAR